MSRPILEVRGLTMIERTPWLDLFCHAMLIAGIAIVCLPLYYAVIAATHTLQDVLRVPMPLLPGGELGRNLQAALETSNLGRQLVNSLIVSVGVTGGSVWLDTLTSGTGVADIRLSGGTLGAQSSNAVWSAPMALTKR